MQPPSNNKRWICFVSGEEKSGLEQHFAADAARFVLIMNVESEQKQVGVGDSKWKIESET